MIVFVNAYILHVRILLLDSESVQAVASHLYQVKYTLLHFVRESTLHPHKRYMQIEICF